MSRSRLTFKLFRDSVCLLVGVGGIIFQQVTGEVDWQLLLAYLALIGTPGALNVATLLRPSTPEPPSQSPPLSSSRRSR